MVNSATLTHARADAMRLDLTWHPSANDLLWQWHDEVSLRAVAAALGDHVSKLVDGRFRLQPQEEPGDDDADGELQKEEQQREGLDSGGQRRRRLWLAPPPFHGDARRARVKTRGVVARHGAVGLDLAVGGLRGGVPHQVPLWGHVHTLLHVLHVGKAAYGHQRCNEESGVHLEK